MSEPDLQNLFAEAGPSKSSKVKTSKKSRRKIKALPYNDSDLELWFRQLEFQFELNRYRSERTKFIHVASILPPVAASYARHIILKSVFEEGDYSKLWNTIIKAMGLI
ncbi:hypothetical protein BLOT_006306 [Blomia tropicalis]|nr:hypothetical protein BLOT_006306 [Blomia tropicalis]